MKPRGVEKVLITGGAGFIGSHTADLLLLRDYDVTILDNLDDQVHKGRLPDYLHGDTKFVRLDIRDRDRLRSAVKQSDAIVHLSAAVGVGQSMYQVERYVDYNTRGTSTLLDIIANEEPSPKKVVVASSMSIYGEGKYFCTECKEARNPGLRDTVQLAERIWEPLCHVCKKELRPVPTDENKPQMPSSIYAMTKRHQEEMTLLLAKTYGIGAVALRYFNAYGPRQALSNPYTGTCAIFTSRILNNKPPYIFEDGRQTRDFIHVRDVAMANVLAMESNACNNMAMNIGSGNPLTIAELAEKLIALFKSDLRPVVSYRYRMGDIRHCYADITLAKEVLGFNPQISVDTGLAELASWGREQGWGTEDQFEKVLAEMEQRGLVS